MNCPNCGAEYKEGARFCRSCGRALPVAAAAQAAPTTQPAPVAQPAPVVPPVPTTSAPTGAPAAPAAAHGRLPLDGAEVLVAVIGTGIGALAGYLSSLYVPGLLLPYRLAPVALAGAVTAAAVLAAGVIVAPMAYWLSAHRASQKRIELKRLIQKERTLFTAIDADLSNLVRKEG